MNSDASTDIFASIKATDSRVSKKRHHESAGHLSVESPTVLDPVSSASADSTPSASTFTISVKPPKKKSKQSKENLKAKQSAETIFIDPGPAPIVALSPSPPSSSRGLSYQKSRTDLDHFWAAIRPTNVGDTSTS